jgi:hypothetical protein
VKQLTTAATVGNLTRMACISWTVIMDEATGGVKYARVKLQARPFNAHCGDTEDEQLANSPPPVSLKITNSACSNYLHNTAPVFNEYLDSFVKGSGTYTGLLDAVISARNAVSTEAQKNNAVLTALAAAGAIPPLNA